MRKSKLKVLIQKEGTKVRFRGSSGGLSGTAVKNCGRDGIQKDEGLDVIAAKGLDTVENMANDLNEVDRATSDLKNTNVRIKDTVTKVIRATCNFVDVGAPEVMKKLFFPRTRGLPFKGDVDGKYYKKLRKQFLTNYELVKPHSSKEGVVFLPSTDLVLESPPPPPTTISFRHLRRQQPASPPPTTRYDTDVQGHERKWSLHLAGP
ncbi:hypothetical protein C3L33_00907, partial [Rhododendron williamsianum]